MARADLLVDLVKYAVSGNKGMVKKVTEAIIAEEREAALYFGRPLRKRVSTKS